MEAMNPDQTPVNRKDMAYFVEHGIIIEGDNIASGDVKLVRLGHYGPEAEGILDLNDQPLRTGFDRPFVVQYIDIAWDDPSLTGVPYREGFALVTYFADELNHRNIVPIHMIIERGYSWQQQYRQFQGQYECFERVYIFMDFAPIGSLYDFLLRYGLRGTVEDNVTESDCIRFILDLYTGLSYLHERHIFHRNIHLRNVLVFNEGTESLPVLTLKLSDFEKCIYDAEDDPDNMIMDINWMRTIIISIFEKTLCGFAWAAVIPELIQRLANCNSLSAPNIIQMLNVFRNFEGLDPFYTHFPPPKHEPITPAPEPPALGAPGAFDIRTPGGTGTSGRSQPLAIMSREQVELMRQYGRQSGAAQVVPIPELTSINIPSHRPLAIMSREQIEGMRQRSSRSQPAPMRRSAGARLWGRAFPPPIPPTIPRYIPSHSGKSSKVKSMTKFYDDMARRRRRDDKQ